MSDFRTRWPRVCSIDYHLPLRNRHNEPGWQKKLALRNPLQSLQAWCLSRLLACLHCLTVYRAPVLQHYRQRDARHEMELNDDLSAAS